jgi:hypothetical protein
VLPLQRNIARQLKKITSFFPYPLGESHDGGSFLNYDLLYIKENGRGW